MFSFTASGEEEEER